MRLSFNGKYHITRAFGVYDPESYARYPGKKHPGTDYGLPVNTPLVAGMSGRVTIHKSYGWVGRGNEVVITNGTKQRKTCHMNRIDVKEGQWVNEGDPIGLSGNTGYVLPKPTSQNPNAGAHLHDELLIDGIYVDLTIELKGEPVEKEADYDFVANASHYLLLRKVPMSKQEFEKFHKGKTRQQIYDEFSKAKEAEDGRFRSWDYDRLYAQKKSEAPQLTERQQKGLQALEALKEALK